MSTRQAFKLMLKEDKTKKDKSSLPTKKPRAAHPRNGRSSTSKMKAMVPKEEAVASQEETMVVRMTILV